ncbi:hypothetical protein J437_LFUL012740 [Ladona fulva]|uniref:DUF4780 domain-containing protein n=1 Tax=Ladona fulva TaxID=123851 RepID=A0A8K0KMM6_LADFU|nr:hypothetical protein J437_LFUL012740 [Ladona fulva]
MPFHQHPYPIPRDYENEVHKQIEDMLKDGIIKKIESPYSSPLVVVKKQNGGSNILPKVQGDTPECSRSQVKKAKDNSYAEAAKGKKKMAIIPESYPEVVMTQEWHIEMEGKLEEPWGSTPEGQALPSFEGTRLINGALEVICEEDYSMAWLGQAVEKVGPLAGTIFKAVDTD